MWDGWAVLFVFFISSILSSFSNASSLGRRLDILKYCGLGHYNSTVVVSNYQVHARKVLVNHLVDLSLPRNMWLDMTLAVDWAIKSQQKTKVIFKEKTTNTLKT